MFVEGSSDEGSGNKIAFIGPPASGVAKVVIAFIMRVYHTGSQAVSNKF